MIPATRSGRTRNSGASSSAFLHEAPVTPQLIQGSSLSQPLSPLPGTQAPVTPKDFEGVGAPLIRVTGAEANPRPVVIRRGTRATASRAGPVPPPGAVPLLANPASLTPTVYHGNLGKEAEPAQRLVVQLVTAGWKNLHNLKKIHGKIVAEPAPQWKYCPSRFVMDAQLRRLACPQALQALGSRYK